MNDNPELQVQAAEAPPERGELAYGRAQVAALVIVEGQNVASVPPQVFACVREASDGGGIIALVGPEKDLGSVQDAVLFAQAYKLRAALRELVAAARKVSADNEAVSTHGFIALDAAIDYAGAALDAADPQFLAVSGVKSAEQRLAEAREGYDPSQNPSTSGILSDDNRTVETDTPTLKH